MPTKHRRYSLKTKEAKQVLLEASKNVKFDLASFMAKEQMWKSSNPMFGAFFLIEW